MINTSKQIKLGAILSYISIVFNIITGLFYTPWMVATIGKSQYGLYTLAHSVITLFLVDFGLSSATGRYLSKYNAEGKQEKAACFLGVVYKLYLLIDAVILGILVTVFFSLDRIFASLTVAELEQFRVVYAISAVFSVVNFPFVTFNGILTAYEKFVPLKIADLLYRGCNVVFIVIALLMGCGLYALVTVHAVVGLLILVFKYVIIKNTISISVVFKHTEKNVYKELFCFSAWMTVATCAIQLTINITPAILGMVANSEAIAIFGIITTVNGYSTIIATATNGMFMPKISRIIANGDDLDGLFINVGKFQYTLNGAIVAGFAVVGRSFIELWMGNGYSLAYMGVLLLTIPGLFFNSLQVGTTAMVVINKVKPCAIIHIITGLINLCLSFPMAKHFGVTGACISLCVAYLVRDVLLNVIYHRELPLDIPRFIKECYLRMSVPMVLTIVCGLWINRWIADGGWMIFFVKAAMTAGIYCVTTWFLALSRQDRRKLLNWMKR